MLKEKYNLEMSTLHLNAYRDLSYVKKNYFINTLN
jgi:hypothetical protein